MPNGTIVLRVPRELHAAILEAAARRCLSMNAWITAAVRRSLPLATDDPSLDDLANYRTLARLIAAEILRTPCRCGDVVAAPMQPPAQQQTSPREPDRFLENAEQQAEAVEVVEDDYPAAVQTSGVPSHFASHPIQGHCSRLESRDVQAIRPPAGPV